MINFNWKNIKKHKSTTGIGIFILIFATLFFVWKGKAEFHEITGFLVAILGFLLYGNNTNNRNDPKHIGNKPKQKNT